jgi:hypothetical protein
MKCVILPISIYILLKLNYNIYYTYISYLNCEKMIKIQLDKFEETFKQICENK